jgi:TATA-box binding protein (TBP) (component of TFIID and TFIIIB)
MSMKIRLQDVSVLDELRFPLHPGECFEFSMRNAVHLDLEGGLGATVYKNGSVTVAGIKTSRDAERVLSIFNCHPDHHFDIIMANCSLKLETGDRLLGLNLHTLCTKAQELFSTCRFDPSRFNGMVIKSTGRFSVVVYESGYCLISAKETPANMEEACRLLVRLVFDHPPDKIHRYRIPLSSVKVARLERRRSSRLLLFGGGGSGSKEVSDGGGGCDAECES